jgi:hypothetical protein
MQSRLMSLFDNERFTIYRDSSLEAFYDVDLKNRRKLIIAHVIVYFFPVLVAVMITQLYSLDSFAIWLVIFSLLLYIIAIVETVAYLFPKSRTLYKKYFLWIVIPAGTLIGLGGYFAGSDLIEFAKNHEIGTAAAGLQILAGGAGVFFLFIISQFGLSQILYASKSLYTRRAKVEADIQFATEIQERILREVSIDENGVRAYACSKPANELGGDFFELSLKGDQLFASIGDISGHSFGAGLLMTLTKSALQTHLEYNHDPAKVMSALNTLLNEQTDHSMYATMVLLKLHVPGNKVTLCNAGHLPVYHITAKGGKIVHRYKKGIGLGITEAARYENQEFEAEKGDMLILYSDGLIETRDEQMNVRDAGFFENLIAESMKPGALSPQEVATGLLENVRTADHSSEMEDDSSIIVINI